jgi:spore germination protein YaaH
VIPDKYLFITGMLKKISLLIFFILIFRSLKSQEPDSLRRGIHQVENEFYSSVIPMQLPDAEKETTIPSKLIFTGTRFLTRKALGWHPYWVSASAYLSYDYNALSHIAYFSYEVDTATGGFTSIHDWNTTPLISYAHQKGTKVLLTVTNFGTSRNTKLLSDTVKQKLLLNTLISLLKARNGDGVNFDLESVGSSHRTNLVNFITRAVKMIKAELPDAEISIATPAVDWNGSWNFKTLSELCDYLIVMGYDYYWSGSTTAGPVSPLETETYNVTRTVNTYLGEGVNPRKLLLGVPWYGYDWPVINNTRKTSATGTATARIYTAARQLANTNGNIFDQLTKVPWVRYTSSSLWRQLWYDDTLSLSMKYNLVNSKNLGGIGIWALSYEGGSAEIWRNIKDAFSPPDTSKNVGIIVYPNPVYGISKIDFYLTSKEHVTFTVFDLTGKERTVLVNDELDAGYHSVEFNSAGYGQGFYLCVLQTKKTRSTRTIIIANK